MKEILASVLKEITPKHSLDDKIKPLLARIRREAKTLGIDCEVQVGGSVGKDTHLIGKYDCDVFVRFDYRQYKDIDLSAQLDIILKNLHGFDYEKIHGSRDYFQTIQHKITFELIPVLKIDNAQQAQNVTDMSPHHVHWVKKKAKKVRPDIRLLRAFCKAQRVYGAESYIGGFSGHVLDILTIHYGSFLGVLEASQLWPDKHIIDVEYYYKGKNALQFLNEAKIDSPIIVIDPILPSRNAASALTKEQCDRFATAARLFLQNPKKAFFLKKKMSITNFTKEKGTRYKLTLTPQSGKIDIVGAKLKKVLDYIRTNAPKQEFALLSSEWEWEPEKQATMYLCVEKHRLSPKQTVIGPPVRLHPSVKAFLQKHPLAKEKQGRMVAQIKREFITFDQFLKSLQQNPYVKTKCEDLAFERYSA
ncbi:MAG: tRNA nucleotidyltransferase (CCA-adding enzyme) [Candidatus Woesearchaeota archaeon]|jgi:tRNA nucleotidyltransferase (CCA-adding enzyme)